MFSVFYCSIQTCRQDIRGLRLPFTVYKLEIHELLVIVSVLKTHRLNFDILLHYRHALRKLHWFTFYRPYECLWKKKHYLDVKWIQISIVNVVCILLLSKKEKKKVCVALVFFCVGDSVRPVKSCGQHFANDPSLDANSSEALRIINAKVFQIWGSLRVLHGPWACYLNKCISRQCVVQLCVNVLCIQLLQYFEGFKTM